MKTPKTVLLVAAFLATGILGDVQAQSLPRSDSHAADGDGVLKPRIRSTSAQAAQRRALMSRHISSSSLAGVRRIVPTQYATIQGAIDASIDGDTVLVLDGTYYENIRFRGKRIVVGSTYLTTGDTSHISNTIIDGSNSTHPDSGSVVSFVDGEDTTSVLCGFTIRGGTGTRLQWGSYTYRQGGGVLVYLSSARLTSNIISENTITGQYVWGGGVSVEECPRLIMEGNTVRKNQLYSPNGHVVGGGMSLAYSASAVLRHNVFAENNAQTNGPYNCLGGGLYCSDGTYLIEENTFERNIGRAPNNTQYWTHGGGVVAGVAVLVFRNNRVIGNVLSGSTSVSAFGGGLSLETDANDLLRDMRVTGNYIAYNQVINGLYPGGGGGIHTRDERPLIENNIIVHNSAPYGGGFGAYIKLTTAGGGGSRGAPVLINNTIAFNRATTNSGGAIASFGAWTPKVINTIAWGDTATQEIALRDGSSISVFFSDIQGGWPSDSGNIDTIPGFVPGDTLYHLDPTSYCIGRGIDSIQIGSTWYSMPSLDFDGLPRHRPLGNQLCDIGAQEEQITLDAPGESVGAPRQFTLMQNYPNPFNPKTGIRFQVSGVSDVKITVYDLLGREVAVLVNERKAPGSYEVPFNAEGLASGVYVYRMTAGSFVQSRAMLLIK